MVHTGQIVPLECYQACLSNYYLCSFVKLQKSSRMPCDQTCCVYPHNECPLCNVRLLSYHQVINTIHWVTILLTIMCWRHKRLQQQCNIWKLTRGVNCKGYTAAATHPHDGKVAGPTHAQQQQSDSNQKIMLVSMEAFDVMHVPDFHPDLSQTSLNLWTHCPRRFPQCPGTGSPGPQEPGFPQPEVLVLKFPS